MYVYDMTCDDAKMADKAKERSKNKKRNDPGSCFCKAKKGGTVVQCNKCNRWCHPSCVGLSPEILRAMDDDAPYYCPLCILKKFSDAPSSPASACGQDDSESIARIVAEFDDMRKDLDDLKRSVSDLSAKLDAFQRPISSAPSETGETLRAQQRILESHERALRRNNVIVVGVAEDDSCSTYDAIQKLFSEKLNAPGLSFEARRLGKKKDQGTRSILVRFSDSKSKVSAMKKRSLLKGSKIYMNDDLTPFQKQNQKILLERMRKARGEGKSSYIARGNLFIDGSVVASLDSLEAF